MNKSGLEWKVGLFVVLSLALAAALIMKFSKSASVFTQAYELLLVTSNVGGIRPGASVLMAGVQVGSVRNIDLDQSGKIVTLHVQILARYQIHQDAHFTIQQAGFLGDQYISITPGANQGPVLKPGQSVPCEEPFNLQEVAHSAAGLLRRLDQTAAHLNDAVARMDRSLLAEQTLTNASAAIANFRMASDRVFLTLDGIDQLVQTNAHPFRETIGNLEHFSAHLDRVSEELQMTLATNRLDITSTIQNIKAGTVHLNALLGDLQAGKGLAGSVLKDEQLRADFASAVSHLNVVSSNLSQHGLLWKPRTRRVMTNTVVYPGKNPGR